ncbi:MAG TPA: UvrD-helicase domain-containing protein [Acidimicrobiales bacterium]|nr:UvrD-helicase domain-containing protein [Acidimicrobiales bacterium]
MTGVADHDARRRIAEDHEATLFVEAGAGSGKTSSLVSRVVSLVLAGVDVTDIAAITFTEAAAAELRARVRRTLEDVEAGREVMWVTDSPDVRALAADALDRLDRATTCTLHAFAQRLLLAAPIEARLPPSIQVHDDISSTLRFEDRWRRFEHQLLDDEALAGTMRMALTLGISSRDLQAIADTLGQNWDLVEEAGAAGLIDDDRAADVDTSSLPVDRWLADLDAIAELLGRCTEPDTDGLAAWVTGHALPLRANLVAARDDPYELVLVLGGAKAPARNRGRKECWPDGTKAQVIDIGCRVAEEIEAGLATVTDRVLTRLGAEIACYTLADAEARRREGRLEFHDLLVLARHVLRTERSVRERFHRRYRHLLIDEFQDTDPIQVELAVRIAAHPDHDPTTPWDEVEVEEGRLFFVGDPKQSIYRFRRADIDLFAKTAARYTGGVTGLRVNFRTVAPVLSFCNAVFGGHDEDALIRHAVDDETGATAQPPYVALEPNRPPIDGDPGPPVVVLGPDQPHPSADAARTAEAADVAAVLLRAQQEGWLVMAGARARPCRWSDMAILLPSRTTLAHLRTALDDLGIPYRLESGTLVYGTTEVGDLLAVLRAIDDPGDAIAVVGALRSPAYGCGDDDLIRWSRLHGRFSYLGDAVRSDDVLARLPADAVDPVEAGLADLRARHRAAPFRSVPEAVGSVIRDRRLMELCLAGGRHRDAWRLYRVVLEHARQFADTEDGGLRAFLHWADLQRDDKRHLTNPVIPEADVDAVRILTIHGAKGLEFGITAVSGLSAEDPNGRRGATVRFAPEGGFEVRMRAGMETTRYEAVRTLDETMDEHERIRLLYVALTRARDHLVVSTHHTKRGRAKSHAGRIARRLAAVEGLDGLAVRWTAVPDAEADADGADGADRRGPAPAPASGPAHGSRGDDAGSPPGPAPERWRREVADVVQRRRSALARAGGVRTATALAGLLAGHDGATDRPDDAPAPREPDREPWRRGRAGTSIGSAVHAVLQHADLADPSGADVPALVAWQVAVEGLPPSTAPLIEAKARAALASPVVRRAAASGTLRRELHVAAATAALLDADDGSTGDVALVEGFVDLCFDDGDGLVVVDYKTDDVPGDAALQRALERYRPQGAAYALLLEAATGRPVREVHFLFLRGDTAVDAPVPDLPAAIEQVRAALGQHGAA